MRSPVPTAAAQVAGGGEAETWDQSKVPLPHLPGQTPVFVLQSQKIADVVALDQSGE